MAGGGVSGQPENPPGYVTGTRQHNKTYAQGHALIRKFYMCTENVKIALFKSYCILVPCGANTDLNHYENCVLPIEYFS